MQSTKAPVAWVIFALFAWPFAAHAAPTVSFKAPTSGQTISGNLYQSSACEVGGSSIDRVKFYLDATALNIEENSPWHCNLDTRNFSNGSHTLRAVAYDAAGASASTQITVNIQNGTTNTPPSVSITSPTSGATVKGTSVSCAANASDSNGIKQVQFYLDSALIRTELSSPYNCSFDSTKLSNASHTLRAVATDSLGATSSTQVSFNVSNGTTSITSTTSSTNSPPTVSITSPTSGATVKGTSVSCAANASDSNGIKQVQFYLDSALIRTELSSPYNCSFDS
ncbi:MAG TPA: Ig-like domain-containing protein, partial [Burkholderiales bacterium]|nr:Ig-like domain-containing protein [Burkholderiales bacterium]